MILAVLGVVSSQPALAQTFKKVSVKAGVKLTQIAAGGTSIWGLTASGLPYVSKGKAFIPASTMSFTEIAVGGGNLRQPDTVWALDSAGQIYNASVSANLWTFNLKPGILSHIAVGIGYEDNCHPYEVWGVNPSGLIYRFNYCAANWENIPGTLQSLSVGGGDVYGVNGNSEVYQFNFPTLTFKQIISKVGVQEDQVAAGSTGAWTMRTGSHPLEYDQNRDAAVDLTYSYGFTLVRVGSDGLWALDNLGHIYHFRRAAWKLLQIQAPLFTTMSVGNGAGVWAIDFSGNVWAFSTP
jgi:hypothetical protein